MKSYYRAELKGDFERAGDFVPASRREAYSDFADALTHKNRAALRKRKINVKNIQVKKITDTTAVASCDLIIKTEKERADTVYRVVMMQKEGCRWKIDNGILGKSSK